MVVDCGGLLAGAPRAGGLNTDEYKVLLVDSLGLDDALVLVLRLLRLLDGDI